MLNNIYRLFSDIPNIHVFSHYSRYLKIKIVRDFLFINEGVIGFVHGDFRNICLYVCISYRETYIRRSYSGSHDNISLEIKL